MAGRKRPSSARCDSSKHKEGYSASWKKDFPWHIPVYTSGSADSETSPGNVVGLLCSLCKHHQTKQRNNVGTWTEKPCTLLRRDILQRHKVSDMHKLAEEKEAARLASRMDGGIRQAFSTRISIQRKALIGALNLV